MSIIFKEISMDFKKLMSSKYKWPVIIAAALIIIGLLVFIGPKALLDILFGEGTGEYSTEAQVTTVEPGTGEITEEPADDIKVTESGKYFDKEHVALYIHTYGHLPSNYITKKQAEQKGWSGGSVQKYAPGCAIGGDYFGNGEGLLPKKSGRKWTECDIDTDGADARGAKRIVFSNDGLIYYTDDHYQSFTKLYGE